jgi:hypothetical protein
VIFDIPLSLSGLGSVGSYRYRWDCPTPLGPDPPVLNRRQAEALHRAIVQEKAHAKRPDKAVLYPNPRPNNK